VRGREREVAIQVGETTEEEGGTGSLEE
jgi:hypothetical protein